MEVVYERRGTGTPLVLLHGIGHRWQAWAPVIDRLAERHDVIAVDLPGFGRSPQVDVFDMPNAVAIMTAFFAAHGLDKPHVAGNSLGGLLALELAAAGGVASATALSPAGFWKSRQLTYALAVLGTLRTLGHLPRPVIAPFLRRRTLRRISCGTLYGRPDLLDPEATYDDLCALRDAPAFWPVARHGRRYPGYSGTPTVPVTIAWGTKDRILRPVQAELARTRLPGARHLPLPGCGHVPMNDDPDLVTTVILETTGGLVRP